MVRSRAQGCSRDYDPVFIGIVHLGSGGNEEQLEKLADQLDLGGSKKNPHLLEAFSQP
jgi:hypothetical protein